MMKEYSQDELEKFDYPDTPDMSEPPVIQMPDLMEEFREKVAAARAKNQKNSKNPIPTA
ncbi:hypothetical protein [Komagataeibacter xylinus]|uniref:hypothetical protein n=1 Tax=Komagataeibacter xylinus TaxID=28448 RepID=UPI00280B0615|nr:hypothetical protein [Komagataeibacter xylinus]